MSKITISAIKADVGGYVGHGDVHPDMLAEAESRVQEGISSGLLVDGKEHRVEGPGEYPDIYRVFADLIDERRSLVDVAPFRLVADCLLVGSITRVEPISM